MPDSFERNKGMLSLSKDKPSIEHFKTELLKLAKAGITHVNFDMVKLVRGEMDLDEVSKDDPSHDYLHTLRVLKLAENFPDIGQDPEVLIASVVFHDFITRIKGGGNPSQETEDTTKYIEGILRAMRVAENKIAKVLKAIKDSSAESVFSREEAPEDIEGFILYTVDKLDQSGAVAVMRYFASGGHRKRPSYKPEDPTLHTDRDPKETEYDFSVDGLLYRMPKIERNMWYPAARETIEKRNDFFYDFIKELEMDLGEEKQNISPVGGAYTLMKVFEDAGRAGRPFYDEKDPFAENRPLQPNLYALDAVKLEIGQLDNPEYFLGPENIKVARKKFLEQFMDELREELKGEMVAPKENKPGYSWGLVQ